MDELNFVGRVLAGQNELLEVTIPKNVREALGLSHGDMANFAIAKIPNGNKQPADA